MYMKNTNNKTILSPKFYTTVSSVLSCFLISCILAETLERYGFFSKYNKKRKTYQ